MKNNRKDIYDRFSKSIIADSILKDIPKEHQFFIFNECKDSLKSEISRGVNDSLPSALFDSFYIDEKNKYPNKTKNQVNNRNFNTVNTEWRDKNVKNPNPNIQSTNNFKQNNLNIATQKDTLNIIEMTHEENFHIENSYIIIDKSNKKNINDTMNNSNTNNLDMSSYFQENPNETFFTKDMKDELESLPVSTCEFKNNYNFSNPNGKNAGTNSFTPVNMKSIYKINEKLKYPKVDPLWYIYHIGARSSFGPVSSLYMEEMYNIKNIDGQTDIRLIDIFKIKHKGQFAFFKLKEIENPNFVKDMIDPSNLLKYIDELNKVKKEEGIKIDVKPVQLNTNKILTTNDKSNLTNKNKKNELQLDKNYNNYNTNPVEVINLEDFDPFSKKNQKIIKSKNHPKIENIVAIKNVQSVIDKELNDEGNQKKKTGNKKGKGKLVDINIKTGFYTLTKQEKNYEPIYICGEIENEEK